MVTLHGNIDAVLGILKTGLPVANGVLMDQPPLGFYIQAIILQLFRGVNQQWHISSNLVWAWMRCVSLWNWQSRVQ